MQKKVIVALGVYLILVLIAGGHYALKPYYERYQTLRTTIHGMSEADQRFLAELMRELAEDKLSAGSLAPSGSNGTAGSATGSSSLPGLPFDPSASVGSGSESESDLNLPGFGGNNGYSAPDIHSPYSPNANSTDFFNDPKFKDLARKISLNDQIKALEIVRQSLSDEDIRQLAAWVQDGITSAEKVKIKQLLDARLTVEQIAQLKELYDKYAGQV